MTDNEEAGRTPKGPQAFVPGMLVLAALLYCAGLFLDLGRTDPYDDPSARVVQLVTGALLLVALAVLLWLSQPDRAPSGEEEAEGDQPICPNCLDPYPEGVHFCATCAAPLTFFAGTGGYESIYARTWIIGKAAHQPQRRLHVVGLLFWGLPYLAVTLFLLLSPHTYDPDSYRARPFTEWLSTAGVLVGYLGGLWISLALMRLSARNLRALGAQDEDAPARPVYGTAPYWTFDAEGTLSGEQA